VNKDSGPRHSATASDNSFDTGLFDAGEQSTLTFDAPGTYVYYCTLHGSPDGSGMAATITVTDQ
jgi:plastocyanin